MLESYPMTRRRAGQLGFGQVVLFGLLGPPETLLDPVLRRMLRSERASA